MEYYYKILKENLTHYNLTYHLGLNIDTKEFNEKPECDGGIFFTNKDNIMYFLNYGSKIAKIHIPEGNKIIRMGNKYKAHSIYIDEIHNIASIETIEWIEKEDIDIDWGYISTCQKLSEDFIREYEDKLDWESISMYQILSEEFIEEFKDKVDWEFISICQDLSEEFIVKFQDKVNWKYICNNQYLSEDFIRKFKNKLKFKYILKIMFYFK